MKHSLSNILRRAADDAPPPYLSTHLLFTGGQDAIYERRVAEPRAGGNGLWDVSHQRFRMIVGKAHPEGTPQVVAGKVSAAEAIRLLEEWETAHQGLRHISPLARWRPDKSHYSRNRELVAIVAQRVSAGRISKLRRKAGRKHGAA